MRKLTDKVGARKAETLLNRLLYCAGVLHIGGWMTDAERMRIHRRMMKQWEKEQSEIQNAGKKKQLPEAFAGNA